MNPFEIDGHATSMNRVNGGGAGGSGGGPLVVSDEYGKPYGSDEDDEVHDLGEHYDDDEDDDEDDYEDEPLVIGGPSSSQHNGNGHYRDAVDDGDDDRHGTNGAPASSSSRRQRASRRRRLDDPSSVAASLSKSNDSLCRKGSILIVLLLACGAAMRYFMPGGDNTFGGPNNSHRPDDNSASSDDDNGDIIVDPDRPVPILDPNNFRSYANLQFVRQKFRTARDEYVKRLYGEYGQDNYENMFVFDNVTVGRLVLRSAGLDANPTDDDNMGVSWNRLKRKVLMKLLEVRIKTSSKTKNNNGNVPMPTFIWATGGHSAAAAHGDLYNESYSAVLERAVQPALSELGIWFQGKNYAMGGTASSPEVALCSIPIFGTDMDVLSWDFGMTDGREVSSTEMYFRQASFGPSRPACVALDGELARVNVMRHLEDVGVAALYVPGDVSKRVLSGIPDTFGLSDADIQAMPPFVRSFKCEDAIEKGEPGCGESKWTPVQPTCKDAKYRTGWHPGWKWHALQGNLYGLAILEVVDDALDELSKLDLSDPQARYRELKDMEDHEYQTFLASQPSDPHEDMIKAGRTDETKDFDLSAVFTRPAYCHTARLPAETRYLGILTERPDMVGFFHYDVGISNGQAHEEANNGTRMRLTYDSHERQDCSLLLQMDYKDYFYLGEPEGTKSLVLPNDMELRHYPLKEPLRGMVGIAMMSCDWGKCPTGNLLEKDLESGEWEMSVNGIPVTGIVTLHPNGEASFLRHKDGWYFPPNADGRYELQARVNSVGKYLRFSAFIIL